LENGGLKSKGKPLNLDSEREFNSHVRTNRQHGRAHGLGDVQSVADEDAVLDEACSASFLALRLHDAVVVDDQRVDGHSDPTKPKRLIVLALHQPEGYSAKADTYPLSVPIARYLWVASLAMVVRLMDRATNTRPDSAAAAPPTMTKKSCQSSGLYVVTKLSVLHDLGRGVFLARRAPARQLRKRLLARRARLGGVCDELQAGIRRQLEDLIRERQVADERMM
jgi:hypothetical protein